MGKRREGREVALQLLFHWDLNVQQSLGGAELELFWEFRPSIQGVRTFATNLLNGVIARQATIDEKISKYTANYELRRISAVDRNILRMAIYEMLFCTDVPPVVSINEAIEIAKRFGSEESGRFVNGILDRVRAEVPRSPREAGRPSGKA